MPAQQSSMTSSTARNSLKVESFSSQQPDDPSPTMTNDSDSNQLRVYFTATSPPQIHLDAPSTPSTSCTLSYLAEGGANIIFRLLPTSGSTLPPSGHNKLLRIRKDVPYTLPTSTQFTAFQQEIAPLFTAENLIQHALILLGPGLTQTLNTLLQHHPSRPANRTHDFLPLEEPHGMLITDMTPASGQVLVQMKPKWLSQSRTAPQGSRRCRTCALRAQRASVRVQTATDAQGGCPLDLVDGDEGVMARAAKRFTGDERIEEFLTKGADGVLERLKVLQDSLDGGGLFVLDDKKVVERLCVAMTLRDCTLFLRRDGEVVEARLGDLDRKQEGKAGKWRKCEERLIKEGWYENIEDGAVWSEEKVCRLSRVMNGEM